MTNENLDKLDPISGMSKEAVQTDASLDETPKEANCQCCENGACSLTWKPQRPQAA